MRPPFNAVQALAQDLVALLQAANLQSLLVQCLALDFDLHLLGESTSMPSDAVGERPDGVEAILP